jgi:DNA-binding NtrC family response regulator
MVLARRRTIALHDVQAPASPANPATRPEMSGSLRLHNILAETEWRVIRQALAQEKWNRTRVVRVLGISRRQVFDKIRQYGLHE